MRRAALLVAISGSLLFVAACGGAALPPPDAGEAPSVSAATPAGSRAASAPAASGATPSVPAGFSDAEAALFGAIRDDVQVNCAPRRDNLPPGATDGIECAIGSDLVQRVGVYGFPTTAAALAAYVSRMASYGVALRSGDCEAGTAGDRSWIPGDGPGDGGDLPSRIGCFLDENGTANVRLTCGDPEQGVVGPIRYVGILGAGRDLAKLNAFAERYPEGAEVSVPSPPGICFNDGLSLPD